MTDCTDQDRKPNHLKNRGFTLVEILVVVIILAILAVVALPMFLSSFNDSRESALQMDLHRIRSQLGVYRQQHTSYPSNVNFIDQMTLATDTDGNTAAEGTPGFNLGPYVLHFPVNPNTSTGTVGNGAVGTSDWFYDEITGAFHANDSAVTRAF